jgi:hypothetical protein
VYAYSKLDPRSRLGRLSLRLLWGEDVDFLFWVLLPLELICSPEQVFLSVSALLLTLSEGRLPTLPARCSRYVVLPMSLSVDYDDDHEH